VLPNVNVMGSAAFTGTRVAAGAVYTRRPRQERYSALRVAVGRERCFGTERAAYISKALFDMKKGPVEYGLDAGSLSFLRIESRGSDRLSGISQSLVPARNHLSDIVRAGLSSIFEGAVPPPGRGQTRVP